MNEQSYINIKNAIKELENELKHLQNIPKRIVEGEKKIKKLQKEIKRKEKNKELYKQFPFLFDSLFSIRQEFYTEQRKLESLKSISSKDEISKKKRIINDLQKSLKLFEDNTNGNKTIGDKIPTINLDKIKSIFPEWGNINFFDGCVEIKINQYYRKFIVEQSKRYLDKIKHYYSFKNVPKLEIVISGSEIQEIKNIEVLFYHIDYLTIVGHSFEMESFDISKLKKYTRTYFQLNLPFVFTNDSIKFLCEICDENFPIIPIPELVINRNQSKAIHESFLFKCGNKLIGESVESSKASYVFEVENFNENAQLLFDYIANENNTKKRQTLIRSYELKRSLKFYNRIYHNDFYEWKNEIISNTQL
ncbi:hypothetical protein PQ459_03330 [Chryseobacterium sp. KACC 21268]|nr:hypothetical protein PQ459_03330 [Chryseobacterium sp. KACC 21268]